MFIYQLYFISQRLKCQKDYNFTLCQVRCCHCSRKLQKSATKLYNNLQPSHPQIFFPKSESEIGQQQDWSKKSSDSFI